MIWEWLRTLRSIIEIVNVEILPTFVGCPALEMIRSNIVKAVNKLEGVEETTVVLSTHLHGLPIVSRKKECMDLRSWDCPSARTYEEDGSWHVDCPYCGSTYVTLDNIFGPTACRSILYCKSCKNPFEAMKLIAITM